MASYQINYEFNKLEGNENYSYYLHHVTVNNNKRIDILVVNGINSYVNIKVNNAAQQAFMSMGKQFSDINTALNNYKDKKVRTAIEYVMSL